ncbi:hypothetical protein Tco_0065119 [Tanacetum coccineum]
MTVRIMMSSGFHEPLGRCVARIHHPCAQGFGPAGWTHVYFPASSSSLVFDLWAQVGSSQSLLAFSGSEEQRLLSFTFCSFESVVDEISSDHFPLMCHIGLRKRGSCRDQEELITGGLTRIKTDRSSFLLLTDRPGNGATCFFSSTAFPFPTTFMLVLECCFLTRIPDFLSSYRVARPLWQKG